MSTKTNFKRIALVVVAALGMGVLSSVPSQAAFSGTAGSQLTVTVANGTGSLTGSASDSTTAGTVAVTGLALTNSDSYTVTASIKSVPSTTSIANAPALVFTFIETSTSSTAATQVEIINSATETTTAKTSGAVGGASATQYQRTLNTTFDTGTVTSAKSGAANSYVYAKWYAFQDSITAKERVAGTYTYTVIVTPLTVAGGAGTAQTSDITITIAALASSSLVASAANSTAYIGTATAATSDTVLSGLATASDTPRGYIYVLLKNASAGTAARESVTITTTIGTVGDGNVRGRSVVLKYNDAGVNYNVYADGTAGSGTITVTTPSVSFATKSVNFYAAAPATITATVLTDTLKAGANTGALGVKAVDANGIAWTGTLYVYSGTTGTISNDASSCSYDTTDARHECSITGVASGTASITVRDAATVATSTKASNAVTMTVNTASPASFKLAFDKATYAPGEKATLIVSVLDSAGKSVGDGQTFSNLFNASGLVTSVAPGNGSDAAFSTPAASVTIGSLAAASSIYSNTTPIKTYTFYMPSSGGKVEVSATGGASLPLAGQVKVTTSATVTDDAAAALAAVNALAATVASLRTLITTLTNLVLKIQKKVKA